jgi:lipopolysaccharide/colanic/teichoic acid biosynthesis glycosyltransferase
MKQKPCFYEKYGKRALDVILSGGALVVLSPVIAVTALLVRCKLGTPVIFCQSRPGKDGKIFKLYKFRTMTDQRDAQGNLLPDEVRLTGFGKLLRTTSLDELPELWNILRGDMSIVGPRPLLVKYLPLYNQEQKHRHDVLPGLTGWAQVNGRNSITWEDKFRLDLWYVRNISFALDLKILFLTVKKVFCREGISAENSATMEAFTGSKSNEEEIVK